MNDNRHRCYQTSISHPMVLLTGKQDSLKILYICPFEVNTRHYCMIKVVQHRNILASLLLVLFVVFYVNITFFPHSHQIGDQIITHSHFYGGITTTSHPAHSHSTGGYAVINELSLFLSLALVITFLSFVLTEASRFNYVIIGIARPMRSHFGILPPRAPPVLS